MAMHMSRTGMRGMQLLLVAAGGLAGCQATPAVETGVSYDASDQFEGYHAQHMPLTFEAGEHQPAVVLTLCRRTSESLQGEHRLGYSVHAAILSGRDKFELGDRLQFVADGARISLPRSGALEPVKKRQQANYPISVQDLRLLAGAADVRVRVNTADTAIDRAFDETHLAAVAAFCTELASGG